jgi:hypothetical protein
VDNSLIVLSESDLLSIGMIDEHVTLEEEYLRLEEDLAGVTLTL